jgi:hypothetical protein
MGLAEQMTKPTVLVFLTVGFLFQIFTFAGDK